MLCVTLVGWTRNQGMSWQTHARQTLLIIPLSRHLTISENVHLFSKYLIYSAPVCRPGSWGTEIKGLAGGHTAALGARISTAVHGPSTMWPETHSLWNHKGTWMCMSGIVAPRCVNEVTVESRSPAVLIICALGSSVYEDQPMNSPFCPPAREKASPSGIFPTPVTHWWILLLTWRWPHLSVCLYCTIRD